MSIVYFVWPTTKWIIYLHKIQRHTL